LSAINLYLDVPKALLKDFMSAIRSLINSPSKPCRFEGQVAKGPLGHWPFYAGEPSIRRAEEPPRAEERLPLVEALDLAQLLSGYFVRPCPFREVMNRLRQNTNAALLPMKNTL
jgi:hypothetical protein